ncbi:hypothetical protein [Tenacibaculum sp. E3R01]|uniref:hypothetical protein n=1 Tax=Tenacibaculum sp. E3R01 TaxID=2267227 RepID=UPI0011BDCE96|nr:hypothetical protein [Tenacibaculum sp. E3R01]
MKKILFTATLIAGLAISALTVQHSNAQDTGLTKPPQGQGGGNGTVIKCYCTLVSDSNGNFSTVCKAGTSGTLCAQSKPGGNVQCWKYDGNCVN